MSFIADQQTLNDLNLLGKYNPHSIYGIFNKVRTAGGERLLENMFRHPLTDVEAINRRSLVFQHFQAQALTFPFTAAVFKAAEQYLGMGAAGSYPLALAAVLRKKAAAALLRDEQYAQLHSGLAAAIQVLQALQVFVKQLAAGENNPYREQWEVLHNLLADSRLAALLAEKETPALPVMKVARYHCLLRHTLQVEMEAMLESVYALDVYIAVSDVARTRGFSYARALPAAANIIRTTALQHPGLDNAVANPLFLAQEQNVLFLTGANMAGKSTFMKSFGIAVYLAHMGFPVAAQEMVFSVRDGLYSSINVPDNLNLGYSHFYAEVLRVKTVAEQVSSGKNMIVIFDELFKGTNVKDAYDATLAVTAAFAAYRNCAFIISTHIIEVGEALCQQCDNLQFAYLPTLMEGNIPRYTYRLTEGITSDRHGMMIIENEKILEILH